MRPPAKLGDYRFIYVDNNFERIDILQAKLLQNPSKTLGDTQLKEFVGTIEQFRDPANVKRIADETTNTELSRLIEDCRIESLIRDDWEVRGVFVTNAERDPNAVSYLGSRSDLVVYDRDSLASGYIATGPSTPIAQPVSFDISGYDVVEYRTAEATAFVAPLLASELVQLDGMQSGELFAWNVRQSLGRTKVNKAIAESVRLQSEHKNFVLYHNGLTILCQAVQRENGRLRISGYTVVNGCQSLTTLFENRSAISSELRMLTRLIQLPPESDLAARITRHSNNQNAITRLVAMGENAVKGCFA